MTEDELRQAIALGREQRGVEFKTAGVRTDAAFRATVIRAVLGMANKPDGGVVIIGVHDDGTTLNAIGLSADELPTWSYDDFASNVSTYADPCVTFDLGVVEMDGKSFVVIKVDQFEELPVICKRDYNRKLKNGALYVRPRGKIETVNVPSHVEMREVLQRAAEFLARDMVASHARLSDHVRSIDTSDDSFDAEAEDLL